MGSQSSPSPSIFLSLSFSLSLATMKAVCTAALTAPHTQVDGVPHTPHCEPDARIFTMPIAVRAAGRDHTCVCVCRCAT